MQLELNIKMGKCIFIKKKTLSDTKINTQCLCIKCRAGVRQLNLPLNCYWTELDVYIFDPCRVSCLLLSVFRLVF